jgi:alpha-galactosidase
MPCNFNIRVLGIALFTLALISESFVLAAASRDAGRLIPDALPQFDSTQEPDIKKPIKVFLLSGQSNMVGFGNIAGDRPGTLETLVKKEKKFPHLIDSEGKWVTRNDCYFVDITNKRLASYLTVGVMGRNIGPELQFGHIMGHYHDEVVLVIKIAQGNRSISFDVMPPSSRVGAPKVPPFYKGWQYDAFVEDAHTILDNLKDYYPDYNDQGYEIAGFCWWQGHKDIGLSQLFYELHLVNLIKDLRKEFKAPKAPFAIATVGFDGKNMGRGYREILKAQMAVAKAKDYPEFAGNVMTVDARPFWRSRDVSPGKAGHHYNQHAETYYEVGDSLGRMMATMLEAQKSTSDNDDEKTK